MKRWLLSHRNRIAWFLLIVALGIVGLTLAAPDKKGEPGVDPELYNYLMSFEVSDIYDLEDYFVLHQMGFLPIAPPQTGTSLIQPGTPEIIPFDAKGFPEDFLAALEGEYVNSVPVYGLTVYEDPANRDTVFLNSSGKEIFSIPAIPGYDPYAFLKQNYAWLYSDNAQTDQRMFWEGVFDPARIVLKTKLIPSDSVEFYLYAQEQVSEAAKQMSSAKMIEGESFGGGGGGGFEPMGGGGGGGGGSCTDLHFSAITRGTNIITLTLCCPEAVTNVDIFTTTNLPPSWWRMDATNLPSPLDTVTWVITNPASFAGSNAMSFGAGNPDIHTDIDGIPDDREFFLYHTSWSNVDSDADGLVDGYSGVVGTNSYSGGAYTSGGQFVEGELSWGTDPLAVDTDGDGLSDGDEIRQGFNPTNGNDPPSISGLLSYAGRQTGYIYVVAVASSNDWSTNCSTRLTNAGNYQIIKACLTNYYLKAWRDTDADSTNDTNEAFGIYTNNPIVVTGKLTNINLTITDPDVDADSLPDWWEVQFFGSITNTASTNDPDGDEYSNLEEYLADYSPTNSSSHPHNIEGSISYDGPQTGTYYVVASTSDSWTASGYDTLSTTGSYAITHLTTNIQHWVRAYRDSNGNTTSDYFEAWGSSPLNPVLLTNNLTNINITLTNPDTDGDSLPDYWEMQYGFDPSSGGTNVGGHYPNGWWKMDENSGTNVPDSSTYTNTGYLSDTGLAPVCWTTGTISNSLSLNGTNAFVQLYDSDSLKPANLSILAWVRPDQAYSNGNTVFFSKRNPTNSTGYELSYTNGHLTFIVYASTFKAASVQVTLPTNGWMHLAATYDGSNQRLYTNGGLAASTNWDGGSPPPPGGTPISHSTINPCIGASASSPTNFFMGRMDDVRLYSMGLQSNDVSAVYDVGKDSDGDGLSTWKEYQVGTDPNQADTDGDGRNDGVEVGQGSNPNIYEDTLVFTTSFESVEGYATGGLSGQRGWLASSTNTLVQSNLFSSGSQGVFLRGWSNNVAHYFFTTNTVITNEVYLYLSDASVFPPRTNDLPATASSLISYDPTNGIVAFNGSGTGTGTWVIATNTLLPNQWIRLGVVQNYSNKTWSLQIGGINALTGLGFKDNDVSRFNRLEFQSGTAGEQYFDSITIKGP